MSNVYRNITEGLFKYLIEANILPVALPNLSYDGDKPYLRISLIPGASFSMGYLSADHHRGLFQVDVVDNPLTNLQTIMSYVDQVRDAFPRGLHILESGTTIRIDTAAFPGPPQHEVDGYFVPVTIPYNVID